LPATVALHDTAAVPDPVTLLGFIAPQTRPVDTVSVRVTLPLKLLSAVIVMVEMAEVPTLTAAGVEAVIVKSVTMKVAVAEWERVPLVPVIART
jgi:hypothetical protein